MDNLKKSLNVCAVIITYNPDNKFPYRLGKILEQVDHICIVDNHSSLSVSNLLKRDSSIDLNKISIIENEFNEGLGKALNQGIGLAIEMQYDWVITFDQDSIVSEKLLSTLEGIYNVYGEKETIALIGVNFNNQNVISVKSADKIDVNYTEIDQVITSGTLMSLSAYKKVGPFREDFFIDRIDNEYCLRAKSKNYRILMAMSPLMEHSLGNLTSHHLLGKSLTTTNHSALRRYYIVRNEIMLLKIYGKNNPKLFSNSIKNGINVAIKILFFEKDKLNKIISFLKGIKDGIIGNMGKRPV